MEHAMTTFDLPCADTCSFFDSVSIDKMETMSLPNTSNYGILESLWLNNDIDALSDFCDSNSCSLEDRDISLSIIAILSGKIVDTITSFSQTALAFTSLITLEVEKDAVFADKIRLIVHDFISRAPTLRNQEHRMMQCNILGTAYLELYCQANYTGPELSDKDLAPISSIQDPALSDFSINQLECDGAYPYPVCVIPFALLAARAILAALATPTRGSWKQGVHLDENGVIIAPKAKEEYLSCAQDVAAMDLRRGMHGAATCWRSVRAVIIHARALQQTSHTHTPSLWRESQDMFEEIKRVHGHELTHDGAADQITTSRARKLAGQMYLEWGLCMHHFDFGDKGRALFQLAKSSISLRAELTAAMGKRTKYQQTEHAQLYLFAESYIFKCGDDEYRRKAVADIAPANPKTSYKFVKGITEVLDTTEAGVATADISADTADASHSSSTEGGGWMHAEWELGRRLVGDVARSDGVVTGEEAAVREVMLDSMDGGPQENILLEGGPKFSESSLFRGGSLHPIDQAVVLALCLDVKNSNPVDGLTNEEMFPYIERVLQEPQNWMVHSTALLQRSWLEYEKRKTLDRALLQMQALLDQHSTKLTIMQSTYKSIEESAPAYERLKFIHSIVYPARYELKRDLAQRYLNCQVYNSALNFFKELEMWDDVVTCYQLLDKPHRAELVVRERLKTGETPYMLTALGDLTHSEDCYERAWVLSNRRYARAKRTLGYLCFDKKAYAACCEHLDQALSVHPLVPRTWYIKGLACMHLEKWDEGIQAFSRCVQQDMEIGEAWANMGAIYMRQKLYAKARVALLESLKQKRDSWYVVENLMGCCLSLGLWVEVAEYMNMLLDQNMRSKSQRPIHFPELRTLVREAVNEALETLGANEDLGPSSTWPFLTRTTETLLLRITKTLDSDPDVWEVLAVFYEALGGHMVQSMDARVKQFRALLNKPNWEKSAEAVDRVKDVAAELLETHRNVLQLSRETAYGCKSQLATALRKCESELQLIEDTTGSSAQNALVIALNSAVSTIQHLVKQAENLFHK